MVKRKPPAGPPKRLVWRISEAAPLGEFVDPNETPAPPPRGQPEENVSRGWAMSSFELLNGTEVSEGPDTVPDELFDELFPDAPRPPAEKPPRDE